MIEILKVLYETMIHKRYTVIENNEVKIKLSNGYTYLDPKSFSMVAKRRFKVFKIDAGLKYDIVEQTVSKELVSSNDK